ncbi:uncharacterized protein LOC121387841 [Gigantopelta aegis]|uniref:uncharacterized protein LOC121387841 n=1 Tax=Gigantopelta aegis TaxID=1735272 RepID=UPI001B888AA7|nr:uncharacterized protein LOC121387841 [Gigantopelta aegis]XP_041375004.1 uncharacterized protein LOC121387841 [Gigantopelta aegis]
MSTIMGFSSMLPYTCIYIDADFKHLCSAMWYCLHCPSDRVSLIKSLQKIWTTSSNPNPVLPLLSVRTGLDLYLTAKAFPPGSEVIMSAINIPDMAVILKEHKLKIIPVDVSLDTTAPKTEMLESLRSEKTVALLVTHLYGKWFDMEPVISFAEKYNLAVIEDCAEGFCGFKRLGHPKSDIALFSFGLIKYYSSFGGAIAKIREPDIFEMMSTDYQKCPVQSHTTYFTKLLKYSIVYLCLNCPSFIGPGYLVMKGVGINHNAIKHLVVNLSRGFPGQLLVNIRKQPSTALLSLMVERQSGFSQKEIDLCRVKGEYIHARLPDSLEVVGSKCDVNNYWLFPILVEDPDDFMETLNSLGVDAYRGATQLNLIEPSNGAAMLHPSASMNQLYPHEAKYMIDHVVYLPVNKSVPFHILDRQLHLVRMALRMRKQSLREVKLPAKL